MLHWLAVGALQIEIIQMPANGSHLSFGQFKDKLVWAVFAAFGLWVWRLDERTNNQPTRLETREMIAALSPYAADKALIEERFNTLSVHRSGVSAAIDANTKAINEMRIQVERMLVIKPSEVYRKVEEMEDKVDTLIDRLAIARPPPAS